MRSIWAPSRLHFGLLSLAGDGEAVAGSARRTGAAGAAVRRRRPDGRRPGVRVAAAPAAAWSADGPLAERALAFALRFAESIRRDRPGAEAAPQQLTVLEAPPEHVGLGVGTQLGMAVARALAEAWGLVLDAPDLARRVGRGERSALGVHGFAHGGFLVEAGKRRGDEGLAPLAARALFPPQWRLVLATPSAGRGLHGRVERQAFARLASEQLCATAEALCRLVLLGMLPALAEADLEAFGESLHDFNARVGEAFAEVQGGVYADPRTAECVEYLRGEGVRGVGQSRGGRRCSRSWGTRTGPPTCGGGWRSGSVWGRRRPGRRRVATTGRSRGRAARR